MSEFDVKLWQDRQLDDDALYKNFVLMWRNGEYQQALNILNNNAQLSSKKFVAGVLNTIGAALTYLQNNYFENVEDVLAQKLAEFDLAVSRFKNEQAYNPTKQYYINNFVLYNEQYYMCIQDSLGNLPTNTTYWELVGLKGEQGVPGTGLNLRYSWNPSLSYAQYDVVYLTGVLYVALQSNIGKNPFESSTYWQVLMEVPKTSMTISRVRPNDEYVGQIWIRMLMGAYTWQEVNDRNYTFEDVSGLGIDWNYVNKGGW